MKLHIYFSPACSFLMYVIIVPAIKFDDPHKYQHGWFAKLQ